MWHASTLLGLIRHAYWWGDKKWEKTLIPSACSHWMDSRVTSTQPTVRLWCRWRFQKLVLYNIFSRLIFVFIQLFFIAFLSSCNYQFTQVKNFNVYKNAIIFGLTRPCFWICLVGFQVAQGAPTVWQVSRMDHDQKLLIRYEKTEKSKDTFKTIHHKKRH